MPKNIVVLGAGVSGLTTAVLLLREGYTHVKVVARHFPGDMSSEYTSPWAGASIMTVADANDSRLQEIDLASFQVFGHLADKVPEANVMHSHGIQYMEEPGASKQDIEWIHRFYNNVKEIPKNDLIPGAVYGYTFDGYTANVPRYLKWLVETVKSLGGQFERKAFTSLQQVIEEYKDSNVFVNCTGYGSYSLEDVKDTTMYPIRGQTILVRAPHVKTQHYIDAPDCWTYIIPRNDGTVICGGTVDRENRQTQPDEAITKDILERCYRLYPDITHGKGPDHFDIVSINVGFRPGRKDGIRLEKEKKRRSNGDKVTVCHNYGHGSHGYQSSWGASAKLVQLLKEEHLSKL